MLHIGAQAAKRVRYTCGASKRLFSNNGGSSSSGSAHRFRGASSTAVAATSVAAVGAAAYIWYSSQQPIYSDAPAGSTEKRKNAFVNADEDGSLQSVAWGSNKYAYYPFLFSHAFLTYSFVFVETTSCHQTPNNQSPSEHLRTSSGSNPSRFVTLSCTTTMQHVSTRKATCTSGETDFSVVQETRRANRC